MGRRFQCPASRSAEFGVLSFAGAMRGEPTPFWNSAGARPATKTPQNGSHSSAAGFLGARILKPNCWRRWNRAWASIIPVNYGTRLRRPKAERIIAEELKLAKWKNSDLNTHAKSHPVKMALALRLRQDPFRFLRKVKSYGLTPLRPL